MVRGRIERNVDTTVGIATDALEKSGWIVASAGEVLKGNVALGMGAIFKNVTDIGTESARRGAKLVAENAADAGRDTAAVFGAVTGRSSRRR
ncbi:Rv1893 family protein [Tsukamurella soli]|uniref:Excreted virulence factor EspC, type VII ESX diderm n=1 Tax=Tsukamurella soli TaxID=644556 RepID=A0ABP8JU28_9ACTN